MADKSILYQSAVAVTPSDTVGFAETGGIYVGGVGDLTVVMADGRVALFTAVPIGTLLPIRCTRVNSTGTLATAILALY